MKNKNNSENSIKMVSSLLPPQKLSLTEYSKNKLKKDVNELERKIERLEASINNHTHELQEKKELIEKIKIDRDVYNDLLKQII